MPLLSKKTTYLRHSLHDELDELRATVHHMADALRAAADGHPEPAQAFCASGVLGLNDLEPGNAVLSLNWDRGEEPGATNQWIEHRIRLPENATAVVVRRLYVAPQTAPGFKLLGLSTNGTREHLGTLGSPPGIACELFSKRYGSPIFNLRLEDNEDIGVRVHASPPCSQHFQLLALGQYLQGRGD